MVIMFDTTAIAKRYRDEIGRDQVLHWLEKASEVVMAIHCKVEVASSLCRDLLDGLTNEAEFAHDLDLVNRDFEGFRVQPLSTRVEELAIQAMAGSRLRAMDALHIASARVAGVDVFVTADKAQAKAAQAFGLNTELVFSS